ncbi:uncharacterized protein LOC142584668 [Dermacentor variabilis]|uniref:uncharacterized protein LOC142584668 n=1 Tax=Dermacentor variabilis TaxID=34621 RepID=UPI003F5B9898
MPRRLYVWCRRPGSSQAKTPASAPSNTALPRAPPSPPPRVRKLKTVPLWDQFVVSCRVVPPAAPPCKPELYSRAPPPPPPPPPLPPPMVRPVRRSTSPTCVTPHWCKSGHRSRNVSTPAYAFRRVLLARS